MKRNNCNGWKSHKMLSNDFYCSTESCPAGGVPVLAFPVEELTKLFSSLD